MMAGRLAALDVTSSQLQAVAYAHCPQCRQVTPTSWVRVPTASDPFQAITAACACCGDVHQVIDERGVLNGLDSAVLHDACGTLVHCPGAAEVIRCATREDEVWRGIRRRTSEVQVNPSGILSARVITTRRNEKVGITIAVHVPRRTHREPEKIAFIITGHREIGNAIHCFEQLNLATTL